MPRLLTLSLLLSSCADLAQPVEHADSFVASLIETPDGLPLVQAPPPAWIPQFEVGPVYAGDTTDVLVRQIPQGAQVFLLKSEAGPGAGACHPNYPICASLRNPMSVVASGVAGPSGEVALLFSAANNAVAPHWFQAAIVHPASNTARVTSVLLRIPGDFDGDFILDGADNCVEVPNGAQIDQDSDGFGVPCDCADNNAAVRPGATEIPGNGIDDDCVGGDESAWAGTYQGDLLVETSFIFGGDCVGTVEMTVPVGTGPITGSADCNHPFLGQIVFDLQGTMTSANVAVGQLTFSGEAIFWDGAFSMINGQASFDGFGTGTAFGFSADAYFQVFR